MMASMKKGGGGLLALIGGAHDEDEGDPMSDKMAAAGDLIAAVKSGDAEGVAHAFQAMYDACAMSGEADEEFDAEEE